MGETHHPRDGWTHIEVPGDRQLVRPDEPQDFELVFLAMMGSPLVFSDAADSITLTSAFLPNSTLCGAARRNLWNPRLAETRVFENHRSGKKSWQKFFSDKKAMKFP